MAALGFQFNANEVPKDERELLPAGSYTVLIEDSEMVQTKSGTGTMLKLKMNVIDGHYRNRKLFWNLNIQNQSAEAQRIGQQQLAQVAIAVGRPHVADSSELHMIPFQVRVAIRQDKTGQYPDQNECKEAKPIGGGTAFSPQQSAQRVAPAPAANMPPPAQQQAATANGRTPPWMAGKS